MLKARMNYGAVSAKVMALYGRLFTEDDWRRLCECVSPGEVLSILKYHPGWSAYVSELPAATGAEELKKAIGNKQQRDYEKLYRFCNLEDKELFRVLCESAEYGGTAAALHRSDNSRVFADVSKNYHGSGKAMLKRFLGAQADLLNIVSILRLHRHFSDSLQDAQKLLVPVYGRLKPKLVDSLLSARSEQEAIEFLKLSPFSAYFDGYKPQHLDRLYERAMISFCRRLIKMPEPNICVAVAFLTLSELECTKLIRIIEALGYDIKPEDF